MEDSDFFAVLATVVFVLLLLLAFRYMRIDSGSVIDTSPGIDANPTMINWGNIAPGGTANQSVTIYNVGNCTVTLLFSTFNWTPPEAENFITFDPGYQNETILQDQSIMLDFSLAVSSQVKGIDDFSFFINVTACPG